jgi:hypothetical protein
LGGASAIYIQNENQAADATWVSTVIFMTGFLPDL